MKMTSEFFKRSVVWLLCGCSGLLAEETDPLVIVDKVKAAYAALPSYQSEGECRTEIKSSGRDVKTTTKFSIRMQRPEQFRITWNQTSESNPVLDGGGATWMEGDQAYFFMTGTNAKTKMQSGRLALSAGTGVSGGVASTVPSLFFSELHGGGSILTRPQSLKLLPSEAVEGESCYVLSGSGPGGGIRTIWISKADFLVRQFSRVIDLAAGKRPKLPEISDKQLKSALEGAGTDPTPKAIAEMRKMMEKSRKAMETRDFETESVEIHRHIKTGKIAAKSFVFEVPEGAKEKGSLFDQLLGK